MKPSRPHVGIAAYSAVTPYGHGAEALFEGLLSGKTCFRRTDRFAQVGLTGALVAECPARPERGLTDAASLAIAACRDAVAPVRHALEGRRIALLLGTSHGDGNDLGALVDWANGSGPAPSAQAVHRLGRDDLDRRLAAALGLPIAFSSVVYAACASGIVAIGEAHDRIARGEIDAAIVVAVDALSRPAIAGFASARAAADDAVRPFDPDRRGTIVGEGAAAFVIAADDVLGPLRARILGVAETTDAHHAIHVEPSGSATVEAIRACLDMAGVEPRSIEALYLHGTGTRQNDAAEARAVHSVFGDPGPAATAVKSMLGHSLGSASAIAAVCAIETLCRGVLPRTPTTRSVDPDARVHLALGEGALAVEPGPVLVLGQGFGGINAALCLDGGGP